MKRLHRDIVLLFAWFFVFYNVERLLEQVNLASFVYLLAPALGIFVLLFPGTVRLRLYWHIPLTFACVVVFRWSLGYALQGPAVSLIVTETLATWITLALTYELAGSIDEYQRAAATAICDHLVDRCKPMEEVQSDVIREVRRSRHFNRPIAVLAIRPVVDDQQLLDRFSKEFHQRLLRQYASARAARMVGDQLQQHDILAQNENELIALLPETDRDDAEQTARKLTQTIKEKLGLNVYVGLSMFPEDEITAIGLIERAEEEMQRLQQMAEFASETPIPSAKDRLESQQATPAMANEDDTTDERAASQRVQVESAIR